MLVFLLLLSCLKRDLGYVNKVFPFDVLEKLAKEEPAIKDIGLLKSLGLEDTLSSLSKLLFTEVLGESELSRKSPSLIYRAILEKQLDIFKSEFKEDVDLKDQEILTLCFLTLALEEKDIFEYVVAKAEDKEKRIAEVFKAKDKIGRILLHFAFLAQNSVLSSEILSKLKAKEQEDVLKEKDRNGLTCFHYLAVSGLFEKYKKEKTSTLANTLFGLMKIQASETEFLDELEKIVLNIGTIETLTRSMFEKDNRGLTPLHYAAYFGNVELCKAIFSFGIDENVLGNIRSEEIEGIGRITPLDTACISGESEVVRYFEEGKIKIGEKEKSIKDLFFTETKEQKSFADFELYDFKQELEKGKASILHELIRDNRKEEAFFFLDKLKELEQEKRDEFLKHKDEKGDEVLYLAIDKENIEIVEKIIELYSEKGRNKRLCFEYYEETILDRAIKNRSAKVMISLVELKKKYRPEDLEDSESNKVRTETVIIDILEKLEIIVEEGKEESFESEEILLNEEEQKESMILKLIEEIIKKKQDKEEAINKENKFKRLIKEKKEKILILSSYVGDKGVIGRYVEGREVNTKDKDERTPLSIASAYGNKELVGFLITKGAAIDLAMNDGRTPLSIASAYGNKELVGFLITKGAAIDKAMNDGTTPLYIASGSGYKEVVELLIKNGASIDLSDKDGITPLYVASSKGHKEVVELLITNGAAIDLGNKNGATPLYIASYKGRKEVVELLITNGADVNKKSNLEETALFIASYRNNIKIVEILLNSKADLNQISKCEWTALMWACYQGHSEVVKFLIDRGANFTVVANNWNELMIAVDKGHLEAAKVLIESNYELNKQDKAGWSPLMRASLKNQEEVVELLLKKSVNVNLSNKDGFNALMIASFFGCKETVQMLLDKGAELDKVSNDGYTALELAKSNVKDEIVKLLKEKGAREEIGKKLETSVLEEISLKMRDSSFSLEALALENEDDIKKYANLAEALAFTYLKDRCFDIPKLNRYRYNGLHFSVLQQKTHNLKKLLIDDNIKTFVNSYDNEEKSTCLGLAAKLNKLEHVKVLLSFLSSPKYLKYSYSNKDDVNNVLDIGEIKEYVTNKMIFEVLKEGRSEDASKLLLGHVKSDSKLEVELNDFDYTKIIDLKALDEDGKNVFHYLAIYAFNEDEIDHFMNRRECVETYSEELLFAYDNLGNTPFHYALLNSNEFFVKYFFENENINKDGVINSDVLKANKNGQNIDELIKSHPLSKEVINLFLKHIWRSENEDNITSIIRKDNSFKFAEIVLKKTKLTDQFIKDMIKESVDFNALKCLNLVLERVGERSKEFVTKELMFQACKENKEEILSALVKVEEAKLIEKNEEGETVLHLACSKSKVKMVEKLLEYEIVRKNINTLDEDGNTAMHNAHTASSPSIISRLKQAGADPKILNNRRKRAIDLLENRNIMGQEHSIKLGTIYAALCALLNKEYDADYELILHLAVEAEEYWVLKEGCVLGLINKENKEGDRAIHLGVFRDKEMAVKILLEKGSNFLERNNNKETALELVKSREVLMPIIEAAFTNQIQIPAVTLLNRQNEFGNTLLHLAVMRSEVEAEIIKEKDKNLLIAILDNGADVEKVNNENKGAIRLGRIKSKVLGKFLEEYIPNLEEMRTREAKYLAKKEAEDNRQRREKEKELEVIDIVNNSSRGVDERLSSGSKNRAIHLVARKNDHLSLVVLLDKGADPFVEDDDERNCFEIAALAGNIDVFMVLAKRNDIFRESEKHPSAVYLSIDRESRFFEAICERLKKECDKGYNVNNLRDMQHDPVMEIMKADSVEMLKKLMKLGLTIVYNRKNILLEALSREKNQIFEYLMKEVEGKIEKEKAIENWQDEINCKDGISIKQINAFKILVKGDIFKESRNGVSAIHLGIRSKEELFPILFERLEEEKFKGKIDWLVVRRGKSGFINEIIEKDDWEILDNMLKFGMKILDEKKNNMLIDTLLFIRNRRDARKVFDYLVKKIESKDIILEKFKHHESAKQIAENIKNMGGILGEVGKNGYYDDELRKKLKDIEEVNLEIAIEEIKEVLNTNRGYDQNLSNEEKPIHTVIKNYHKSDFFQEALIQLIKSGSDLNWENKYGENCYEIVNYEDKALTSEVFGLLIKGKDIFEEKKRDNSEEKHPSILFLSIIKGEECFDLVYPTLKLEHYYNSSFDITNLRKLDHDPVIEVIKNSHVKILEKLMEVGLKIVDEDGNNLLIEAIINEKRYIFDYLIQKVDKEEIIENEYMIKINGKLNSLTALKEAEKKEDKYYWKILQDKKREFSSIL